MKLTPKQEKFVQGLVSGLSQREAYKAAYNAENMKDSTIDERASRLAKESKVSTRYEELMSVHTEKALWTREKAVNDLIWIKERAKDSVQTEGVRQANSNAFLNAVKELNALENLYANVAATTDLTKARTELIKGAKKDTSLLEALIDVVKEK